MLRDLRSVNYILLLVSLAIIAVSCSGGNFVLSPELDLSLPSQRATNTQTSHQCWGLYDIFISADRTDWDIVPRRSGMAHLNIVPFLEGEVDFLTIPEDGIEFGEEYISATVQIQHPLQSIPGAFEASFFTGFDVKGIIMFPGSKTYPVTGVVTQDILSGDGRVLNPHGYTRWWNPLEFSEGAFLEAYVEGEMALFPGLSHMINATVHPYRNIHPGLIRHSFKPETKQGAPNTASTTYHIVLPEIGEPFALMYAIDASYGTPTFKPANIPEPKYKVSEFPMTANQPEPYFVQVSTVENHMWADGTYLGGGECYIEIDVFDWQDPRYVLDTPGKDRGIRRPFIEAPDLFEDVIKFSAMGGFPDAVAHTETSVEVSAGLIPEGFLIINGIVAGYDETTATNTSAENAFDIANDLNDVEELDVIFKDFKDVDSGYFRIKAKDGGVWHEIKIQDTPNLPGLGLTSMSDAEYIEEDDIFYYLVDNGVASTRWSVKFANDLTVIPGEYQVLIGCPDFLEDPLFPSEDKWPTAYWMLTLEVAETIPSLCHEYSTVHTDYIGTTIVANGSPEYHADCDFIGYPSSVHYGKLLFNKGTQLPDGIQEIAVIDADSQGVISANTIITIADDKKGIPLILQEDDYSGNIIVVNHIFQDNILVFDYQGNFLNNFDHYGEGDNGLNSPVALDFDEQGDLWIVSHRGSTGPELRHWLWSGGGTYTNAPNDLVDLVPIFGTGKTIIDILVMPSTGYLYIFSNQDNGHIEVFDYTQTPPAIIEDLSMVGVFGSPITPVNYPGLRICGGGDLLIDRTESDLESCRVIVAANLTTGPLALQKIDSFANKLNVAYLPFTNGALCLALNNDPVIGKRNLIAFPIAMTNNFTLYAPPLAW